MVFAISVFELHVPGARNLKEKRRVVRSVVDRLRQRFHLSIIESDHHDLHQRAEIALAAVHHSYHEMQNLLADVRRTIDEQPDSILLHWDPQYLEDES